MTIPSSIKDQLAALGINVPCDDIRSGGTVSTLHTSTSDCAVTVEAGIPFCGTAFGVTNGLMVDFLVRYRNANACPPFPSGGSIETQISSNYPIVNIADITTLQERLNAIRTYRVYLNLGNYPVCNSISVTAQNACNPPDFGFGKIDPTCVNRLCLPCKSQNFNVPDLNFNKDITYTNPVSFVQSGTSGVWVRDYRVQQQFSAPTNVTAIIRQLDCKTPGHPDYIQYSGSFSQLTRWTGKVWIQGIGVIDVDWQYTCSGPCVYRYSGWAGTFGEASGGVDLFANGTCSHTLREWGFGFGGLPYGSRTRNWSGCYHSTDNNQGLNCQQEIRNRTLYEIGRVTTSTRYCGTDLVTPVSSVGDFTWTAGGFVLPFKLIPGVPGSFSDTPRYFNPPNFTWLNIPVPAGKVTANVLNC